MERRMGWEELRRRYEEALIVKAGVQVKQREYYWKWLKDFLWFCKMRHLPAGSRDGLELFLTGLRKSGRLGFQVEQARVAVEIFWRHFGAEMRTAGGGKGRGGWEGKAPEGGKEGAGLGADTWEAPADWRMALAGLSKEIGLRRYSAKTMKAYRHWIQDFSRFAKDLPVQALGPEQARAFLTHLGMERKVAAATQNQAFSALLFFYSNVLRTGLQGLETTPRAARSSEIPTVLTRGEVQGVLAALEYPYRLFAQLLYGCGLRLGEGLTLRVQDVDVDGGSLRVHYGKGEKSRSVPLPKSLKSDLAGHLGSVRRVFEEDIKVGFAGVFLPGALDRKLPGAAQEWPWQWVFPAGRLTVSEGDGKLRRFHLHESSVQKEIKAGAESARLTKRVTAHTFRHSYATHLLQMGYDIRTVQELLGHSDVETTMIYTHVIQSMAGKVVSPLDV